MSSVDDINPFVKGQKQLDHKDLEAFRLFMTSIRRGTSGVAPIKVSFSETLGFSVSIDKESDHLDFTLEVADVLGENGVIVPTFAGGTGLDPDGNNNILGEDAPQTYTGAYWTFINQGASKDGTNKSITSAMDTSKPFVSKVSNAVVSGDWVGVSSGVSLLTKDLPGFKVLADMSEIYGDFHALIVRRPVDGMLAKASVAITEGNSGNVKLSETSGTTQGGNFSATNKGSDVAIGDFVQLGEDAKGAVFFKPTKGGGTCGPGDCPDSCDDFDNCFEVCWSQGFTFGCFYVPTICDRTCWGFGDIEPVSSCGGSIEDPETGRDWVFDATSAPEFIMLPDYEITMDDCDGGFVVWTSGDGADLGGDCPETVFIEGVFAFADCETDSEFPCCSASEGCDCLS